MKNKIIGFVNQKGGVGKTTLAALFCSYLAYDKKLPAIAGDFDYPQYSLLGLRQRNQDLISKIQDQEFLDNFEEQTKQNGIYPVFERSLDLLPEVVEAFNKSHEGTNFIFDLAGTINLPGFTAAIKSIDTLVVPFGPSLQDFDSTYLAIESIYEFKPEAKIIMVLNKVKKSVSPLIHKNFAESFRMSFADKNLKVLTNVIYDLEVYKRNPVTMISEPSIKEVFDELYNLI
jgi:chromosome partitioning protein